MVHKTYKAEFFRIRIMTLYYEKMHVKVIITLSLFKKILFYFQFLCLKNIRTFLHTSKRVFELRDSDLFDPLDLFDVKDFRKVRLLIIPLIICSD